MMTIHWLNDGKNEGGVAERQFVIKGGKGPVPGIIWAPDPVESSCCSATAVAATSVTTAR